MDKDFVWQVSIPSNILICGSSNCGKSTFAEKLLATPGIWETQPENIMYCYGIQSENVNRIAKNFPQVVLHEGVPRNLDNPLQIFSPAKNNVLFFDDLSTESQSSPAVTNFMTRGAHHTRTAYICLDHHLFGTGSERRKQSHHWHITVLFRNPRSMHQIANLSRQISVAKPKMVQWAYRDATSKPYGYLALDFRNETPDVLRVVTNVLQENGNPLYAYLSI
jgi:adenylate kinase family enzyme